MLLHEIVERWAADRPSAPALVFGDRVLSWSGLAESVDRMAAALAAVAAPGERVAVVADNAPEWVVAYYAVPRAGLLLGMVNQRLGTVGIREALARFEPAVVLAGPPYLDAGGGTAPVVAGLADDLPALARPTAEPRAGDVAWLIPTSGTTGSPKVVTLTHDNLLAAVDGTVAMRPLRGEEVYLFPFPLCHVAGYNVLQFHRHGRPVVLADRFDPASFLATVRAHGVTTASLAPTMIALLLDHLDGDGDPGADDGVGPLRTVTYGSAPIAPGLLARAIDRLGTDFLQGYGMTEMAGNGVFLSAGEHRRGLAGEPRLLRAAGRATPTLDVRILDDGEVAVRGPQVTAGYWRDPEATAAAFTADGWFRTGDVGRLDDGLLSIVDRKKDIIVTGGENVASREVEDLLAAHPDIAEVAVVGVPDPTWGEVVTAVVVARPGSGLTAEDVLAHGRAAVGGFRKPRHALVVDTLPRNATGKVMKAEVRTLARSARAAQSAQSDARLLRRYSA